MTDTSPTLSLPFLLPNQAQKHVTLNESLSILDGIVQLVIEDIDIDTPSVAAQVGMAWGLGNNPTGDWVGQAGKVAMLTDGGWRFVSPQEGWTAWHRALQHPLVHDGQSWSPSGVVTQLDQLGIGTAPDALNAFAVKSPSVLLSGTDSDGNIRCALNRGTSGNAASIVFQTDYIGQAEIGLSGANILAVRVSDDGTAFSDALQVDTQTGHVGMGDIPSASSVFRVRKDQDSFTQFTVTNQSTEANASSAFRLEAANGQYFNFQLYGSGVVYAYSGAQMVIGTYASTSLSLRTDTVDRLHVHADGRVSIATGQPSAQFSVDGAIRVGQYSSGNLPSASANGAGSIIFITGTGPSPVLAISDGTNWNSLSLGPIVT